MQMRRCTARIAGITHIAYDIARHHEISGLQISESVEVRVVMPMPSGAEDPNHIATQSVLTDSQDKTASSGSHRCSFPREDINPLVRPAAAAGGSPRIAKRHWPNTGDGQRQGFWRVCHRQAQRDDGPFQWAHPDQESHQPK
jgi:hypothetical protein